MNDLKSYKPDAEKVGDMEIPDRAPRSAKSKSGAPPPTPPTVEPTAENADDEGE